MLFPSLSLSHCALAELSKCKQKASVNMATKMSRGDIEIFLLLLLALSLLFLLL